VRYHLLTAFLASTFSLMPGASFAANETVKTEYYLINGPDYRLVTRAVFEEYRTEHDCMRIETKSYPASGKSAAVTQSRCYL
jgi:hypothetical protein